VCVCVCVCWVRFEHFHFLTNMHASRRKNVRVKLGRVMGSSGLGGIWLGRIMFMELVSPGGREKAITSLN
jgi:hypothetical protein